jgi:hypothetical protein
VTVDQRHIIANDHRPVRMSLDHRVQNAATVANVSMVQDAVLNIGTGSHVDGGIHVGDKAHLGSPLLLVVTCTPWCGSHDLSFYCLLYKNRV